MWRYFRSDVRRRLLLLGVWLLRHIRQLLRDRMPVRVRELWRQHLHGRCKHGHSGDNSGPQPFIQRLGVKQLGRWWLEL